MSSNIAEGVGGGGGGVKNVNSKYNSNTVGLNTHLCIVPFSNQFSNLSLVDRLGSEFSLSFN